MNTSDIVAKAVAQEQAMNEEIVYEGYTRGQLHAAFDTIADKENWKMPLRGTILRAEFEMVNAAAIFFAGSPLSEVPTDVWDPEGMTVEGAGYYACIGA